MDDLDDVMETRLTVDYDKQWLNCVLQLARRVHTDQHFGHEPFSERYHINSSAKPLCLQ